MFILDYSRLQTIGLARFQYVKEIADFYRVERIVNWIQFFNAFPKMEAWNGF